MTEILHTGAGLIPAQQTLARNKHPFDIAVVRTLPSSKLFRLVAKILRMPAHEVFTRVRFGSDARSSQIPFDNDGASGLKKGRYQKSPVASKAIQGESPDNTELQLDINFARKDMDTLARAFVPLVQV